MVFVDYKHDWYTKTKPDYKQFDEYLPEYWDMKYRDRFSLLIDFIGVEQFADEGISVLGVGCGLGRALDYFKRYGAKVLGVEPSDYAIDNSRLEAKELLHGNFMEAKIDGKFDVIHVEQVLSHMPDYKHALKKAYSLLKPNGLLLVEEPNEDNHLQNMLTQKHGNYWITDDHCNYFNFAVMKDELEDTGFIVTHTSCTFPMEIFELLGYEYIGNERVGRDVHKIRYEMLKGMNYEERKQFLVDIASHGLGRDLVMISNKGVLK